VRLVCDSPFPVRLGFLDPRRLYEPFSPQADYSQEGVIIVLDTHCLKRVGRVADLITKASRTIICIDHHLPTHFFTPHTVIDPQACSVGAMIYTLFKEMGHSLNLTAANGIYASIVCDTGRFSYASTSRKAHKLADECLRIGVDPDEVHTHLFQQIPSAHLRVLGRVLGRMELYAQGRLVVQMIAKEDYEDLGVDPNDLDFIIELNKSVQGAQGGLLLRELPSGQIRLSARGSASVNVERPMKALGGGGHTRAAGAVLPGPLEVAKDRAVRLLMAELATS
jgi:phosphoesterase RecJ-like protein